MWVVFLQRALPLDRWSVRCPRHATEMSTRQLDVHLELGETSLCLCPYSVSLPQRSQKGVTNRISAWKQRDGDLNLLWARYFILLKSLFWIPKSSHQTGTQYTLASFSSFFLSTTPHPPTPPVTIHVWGLPGSDGLPNKAGVLSLNRESFTTYWKLLWNLQTFSLEPRTGEDPSLRYLHASWV